MHNLVPPPVTIPVYPPATAARHQEATMTKVESPTHIRVTAVYDGKSLMRVAPAGPDSEHTMLLLPGDYFRAWRPLEALPSRGAPHAALFTTLDDAWAFATDQGSVKLQRLRSTPIVATVAGVEVQIGQQDSLLCRILLSETVASRRLCWDGRMSTQVPVRVNIVMGYINWVRPAPADTATHLLKVLPGEVFEVFRELDTSEGRGGRVSLGYFTSMDGAHRAAQWMGVQGSPGPIYLLSPTVADVTATSDEGEKITLTQNTVFVPVEWSARLEQVKPGTPPTDVRP